MCRFSSGAGVDGERFLIGRGALMRRVFFVTRQADWGVFLPERLIAEGGGGGGEGGSYTSEVAPGPRPVTSTDFRGERGDKPMSDLESSIKKILLPYSAQKVVITMWRPERTFRSPHCGTNFSKNARG